jgi:aryl-alcohol dehydrogenase-like predicted oxidoreductase
MMQGIENSLRRLKTDYIDFYFVHDFDELTLIEETLKTLDDLQRKERFFTLQLAIGQHGKSQRH